MQILENVSVKQEVAEMKRHCPLSFQRSLLKFKYVLLKFIFVVTGEQSDMAGQSTRALSGYVLVQVSSDGDPVPRRVLLDIESGEPLNEGSWQISGKERPFPEKMFQTEFSKERLVTLIEALKLAIDKEEQDGIQSIEKDYSYSIVVTSYEKLYLPVHLNEM